MTPEDRRVFNESRERMAELRRMQLELHRMFRVVLGALLILAVFAAAVLAAMRSHR